MSTLRNGILTASILLLASCTGFKSHTEVEALNEVEAVGSPFTQQLAAEYRDYANAEQDHNFDYPDALHFARKGLAAASGEVVMPEPISDWNLKAEHIEQLSDARARLIVAFDLGAREMAPKEAAIAQARFDCWIEKQEENWSEEIKECRTTYLTALDGIEGQLHAKPEVPAAPAPEVMAPITAAPAAPAAEPMAPQDAMYLVFFDFDSSKVGSGGMNVLDAVAEEIKGRDLTSINIIGHTDTSGSKKYNQRLALRRGNAVRDALAKRGVAKEMIRVESKGELQLLVETPDSMREPANRRVEITFE